MLVAATTAAIAIAAASPAARAADGRAGGGSAAIAPANTPARTLSFGGEARLRYTAVQDARLVRGNDTTQADFRGFLHGDYRPTPMLRVFGEIGTGQLAHDRAGASPGLQNRAALQQLFADIRTGDAPREGKPLLGATIGRQEFAEGPRQLLSVGDGSNLHRTWNGVRAYARSTRAGITLFALRLTRLEPGAFDDGIRSDTTLRGAVADLALSPKGSLNATLQPFWYRTTLPAAGARDTRDTAGLRLTGSHGALRWDWTLARQQGERAGHDVRAWGVFAVQSLALSDAGWKPRLTSHVDIASGGGTAGNGVLRDFHPLYSSSSYLGEGQYLALSNLLLVAPGIAVSPSARTTLTFEYGRASRLARDGAVYASGMRAYEGTVGVRGRHVGDLARLGVAWTPSPQLTLNLTAEHLDAGAVLDRAGLVSGTYVQLGALVRY